MAYPWIDYTPDHAPVAESFLDDTARRMTGCEDGWEDYYTYWATHPATRMGENFWAKVICPEDRPIAVMALALHSDGTLTVSEFIVSPCERGKGHGTAILRDLLAHGREMLGVEFGRVLAVIYPHNTASKRAFEKAGFRFESAHPDGDAHYYVYERE